MSIFLCHHILKSYKNFIEFFIASDLILSKTCYLINKAIWKISSNLASAFITLTLSSSFDARLTGASKQSGASSICKAIQRVRSKVAVISKAISNVCLYGNLDIRCRLDYEVGIAHLILHQYPQAHLYSGLHTCSSIQNSRWLAGIPALGAVVFSAIISSVRRHSSGES